MEWDLAVFFSNELELNEFIDKTDKLAKKFNEDFKGKLSKLCQDDFQSALILYENISENLAKLQTYAYLNFAKNTKLGYLLSEVNEKSNKILENLIFFELEFTNLNDDIQDKFISHCKSFSYFLYRLKTNKSHNLSLAEERILLKTSPLYQDAFIRLFDETMANLQFDMDGKKLCLEEILSLMHSDNRNTRKSAAEVFSEVLQKQLHLLTYILNMVRKNLKIKCELRNYQSGEEIMHQNNQISKKSVDALILVSENNFHLVQQFYNTKAKILGVDKLYDYDRYAPIGVCKQIDFEESKSIILKTFSEFSPKFGQIAKKAFDENWIDAFATPNKMGGAFSHSSVSDTHPFVLLNYTNTKRDLFTMAHELGHAIHQYLSYGVGYFNSDTPLTTAESASIFCEMLTFKHLLKSCDLVEKQALLATKLEDIFATLFRQINFTTFERIIHQNDCELSQDEICNIWMQESKKMFKDSLTLNEYYKFWWSYIPHFIHSPFYCYSYSYAQLFVLAIFGLYESNKMDNFVDIYIKFLSKGGSQSPKDMVKEFGFDIEDPSFWDIGMRQIEKLLVDFMEIKQ